MTSSHSKPNQSELREHYLIPGVGTQTACSCGKSFGLSVDAAGHIDWQIKTQSLIESQRTEAQLQLLDELALESKKYVTALSWKNPEFEEAVPTSVITNKRQELTETGDNKKRMKGVS